MQFTQIALDERMRELTQHGAGDFPIQFYIDELFRFPGQCIPLHWHPELELWQARGGDVTVQLGTESLTLADGWAVFINADVLHSFRQADATQALGCPNVVFRDELIAPVTSRIHRLYVAPLLADWQLPYIVFRPGVGWQAEFLHRLDGLFNTLQAEAPGHELSVQNQLTGLWGLLWAHRAELPATGTQKAERLVQVRTQKMLRCIHTQFAAPLTLDDIAAAAGISRSEASRCFQACLRTSPVGYLTWYRIEMARRALAAGQDTIEEISRACGFQSASYFCRVFRRETGQTPLQYRRGG